MPLEVAVLQAQVITSTGFAYTSLLYLVADIGGVGHGPIILKW